MSIQYLQRKQIDPEKWDRCIATADNGLIYAYSFYLDQMTTDWDALVMGDYETVMPLPFRKKWNVHYVYQPAFVASLGVFGNNLSSDAVNQFISAIPAKFKLIDLRLNYGNNFTHTNGLHTNYVLSLQPGYEVLYRQYRENIRRNVKKAQQLGSYYKTGIPVADVIGLAQQQMEGVNSVTVEDYENFARLFEYLQPIGKASACGVYTKANELVASCVYFFDAKRAYYILVGNHPNGRTLGASHFLIDRFIAGYAGTSLVLDFEGSDIRNLAFFYGSFGATVEVFPSLWMNRLPWWARLISGKKLS